MENIQRTICDEGIKALLCHLFILSAWATVVGIGIDADAATGCEQADNLNILWVHQFHQVFHDDVDTVFMEVAMIAEGEEIELQAL